MLQPPHVSFCKLIPDAPAPYRADRSALGTLPARAIRYCDAVTSAAAFGWHVYVPMDFSLLWDGNTVHWTYGDLDGWLPLGAAQYPHFAAAFDRIAPPEAQGCSPPFLTALPEPGAVQIWTGLFARTNPGWSLLIRGPANLPPMGSSAFYEGIVETDRWFGPLFVNLRLTRTLVPIRMSVESPLAQVQPLPRSAYSDPTLDATSLTESFDTQDWSDYIETIVRPNLDPARQQGRYAVAARKRRRGECPFSELHSKSSDLLPMRSS